MPLTNHYVIYDPVIKTGAIINCLNAKDSVKQYFDLLTKDFYKPDSIYLFVIRGINANVQTVHMRFNAHIPVVGKVTDTEILNYLEKEGQYNFDENRINPYKPKYVDVVLSNEQNKKLTGHNLPKNYSHTTLKLKFGESISDFKTSLEDPKVDAIQSTNENSEYKTSEQWLATLTEAQNRIIDDKFSEKEKLEKEINQLHDRIQDANQILLNIDPLRQEHQRLYKEMPLQLALKAIEDLKDSIDYVHLKEIRFLQANLLTQIAVAQLCKK